MAHDADVPEAYVPGACSSGRSAGAAFTRPMAVRLAMAGLVADVAFALLMAAVAFLVSVVVPPCRSDSCMGGAQLVVGLGAVPFVLFGALTLGLFVRRLQPVWGLAAVATPVALLVLGAVAASWFAVPSGAVTELLFLLVGVGAGPLAVVTAGVVLRGRGWVRVAALPAVVVLVVGAVALNDTVLRPLHQVRAITATVPQPYRLLPAPGEPAMTLLSLDLNPYTRALALEYLPGGDAAREMQVQEGRPPVGAALKAACAPALSELDNDQACVVVASTAPDLAIWRTGVDRSEGQVVVVRAGAMIKIDVQELATDALARSVAGRLQPASARDLLNESRNTYVPWTRRADPHLTPTRSQVDRVSGGPGLR